MDDFQHYRTIVLLLQGCHEKVNVRLPTNIHLPVIFLTLLEVELPLAVSDQETQASKKTLDFSTSFGELKTSYFGSKIVPHVIKETLDELRRENVFLRQRLDKHDERFKEQVETNYVIIIIL